MRLRPFVALCSFIGLGCGARAGSPPVFAAAPDVEAAPVAQAASAPQQPPAPEPAAMAAAAPAPTWSLLFQRYFAAGTEGGCGRSSVCHADQMGDADSAYGFLKQRGYIDGPRSPLASTTNSCLHWFGGNMPPRGGPNARAAEELTAWASAGALNN